MRPCFEGASTASYLYYIYIIFILYYIYFRRICFHLQIADLERSKTEQAGHWDAILRSLFASEIDELKRISAEAPKRKESLRMFKSLGGD